MQPALLPRRGRQAPRRAAMQPWSLKYVPPRCGIAPGGAAAGGGLQKRGGGGGGGPTNILYICSAAATKTAPH